MIIQSFNEEHTKKVAEQVAEKIVKNGSFSACIALSGDLGAGKTVFAKGFARYFGINEADVNSPTFVLMKKYKLNNFFNYFYHIDLYRLNNAEEFPDCNLDNLLSENNLILIEWPERFKKLPKNTILINLNYLKDDGREVIINNFNLEE